MEFNPYIISISTEADAAGLMRRLGVAGEGIEMMAPLAPGQAARVSGLDARMANILKQESLSLGADTALPAEAYALARGEFDALVLASHGQLLELASRLARHGDGLATLGEALAAASRNYQQLRGGAAGGNLPPALGGGSWLVMGILNVTPDSFYDGGRHLDPQAAVERAARMAEEGAHIIDVGGESTRPGADAVSEGEELSRVLPVIERIADEMDVPVSIDTSKAGVARAALEAGAMMINDVTALAGDSGMVEVAAEHDCPLCLMHMQGTPRDMQKDPRYEDVVRELVEYFSRRLGWAEERGVAPGNIMIDPGIGFGKKLEHNLEIINNLDSLLSLGRPLLIGLSRKSFIGMIMDNEHGDRLAGTIAGNVIAMEKGVSIFRVHDVEANRRALEVAAAARWSHTGGRA